VGSRLENGDELKRHYSNLGNLINIKLSNNLYDNRTALNKLYKSLTAVKLILPERGRSLQSQWAELDVQLPLS